MTAPQRRSGQTRRAAASPAPPGTTRARARARSIVTNQARSQKRTSLDFNSVVNEVAIYDTYGPGFVGAYNDNVADDVSAMTPLIQFRSATQPTYVTIEPSHGPWAETAIAAGQDVMSRWSSADTSSQELRWAHARLLCARGAAWIFNDQRGQHGFRVLSPAEVNIKDGAWSWVRDDGTPARVALGGDQRTVWRSWTPHPDSPGSPYTEWVRAVVHVREFIAAKGRQRSDADTSMIPDVVWVGKQALRVNRQGDIVDGVDEYDDDDQVLALVQDFATVLDSSSHRQYHQRGDHLPPMPWEGDDAPKLVSLLRDIDAGSFMLEERSIENCARSLRIPTKLLVEGPGNAKYDNEALLYLAWLNQAVVPRARTVFGDWSRMWFWPAVTEELPSGMKFPKGFQMRLWFNVDELMPRQDNFNNLVNAVKLGSTPAWVLAQKLGLPSLELPEGMTDFQLYETYIGNTNAQQQHRTAAVAIESPLTAELDAAPEVDPEHLAMARRVFSMIDASMAVMLSTAQRECERVLTRSLNKGRDATEKRNRLKNLPDIYAKWTALTDAERYDAELTPERLVSGSARQAGIDMADLMLSRFPNGGFSVTAAVAHCEALIETAIYRGMTEGLTPRITDEAIHSVLAVLTGGAR